MGNSNEKSLHNTLSAKNIEQDSSNRYLNEDSFA